jgi:hypothetical protein
MMINMSPNSTPVNSSDGEAAIYKPPVMMVKPLVVYN